MEVRVQFDAPAALTPGEAAAGIRWGPELIWMLRRKILVPAGYQPPTVQSVARRYPSSLASKRIPE
jgi:hypothetical protein